MNNMDQLVRIAQNLTPYKVKALIMMADALQRNIALVFANSMAARERLW